MNYLAITLIVICAFVALSAFAYIIYFEQEKEKKKARQQNELLAIITAIAAVGIAKRLKAHKPAEKKIPSQEPVYSWDGKNGGIIGKHGCSLND